MKTSIGVLSVVLLMAVTLTAYSAGHEELKEDRPIWMWGLPVRVYGGEIGGEVLSQANEWAMDKFGAEFRLSSVSGYPMAYDELNTLVSEGKFPDVAFISYTYFHVGQKWLSDLARFGKIMSLDKYFDDRENYPMLYKASQIREQMMMLKYGGKIYACPTDVRLEKDDPAWCYWNTWGIRWDIASDLGIPQNTEELLTVLRKIKQGTPKEYRDLAGEPVVPFGMWVGPNRWFWWENLVYQLKGAGWEVDKKMRLLPKWASQETYDSLKYLNLLWREGLLHPEFFTMERKTMFEYRGIGHYGVTQGPSWYQIGILTTSMSNPLEDEADIFKANIMLVPPIREPDGKIGWYENGKPGIIVISKDCPNPDAVMKMFDWCLTLEGRITSQGDAGIYGVDWEFTDPPLNWHFIKTPGSNWPIPEEAQSGTWRNLEQMKENPPKIIPGLMYFIMHPYSKYNSWVSYGYIKKWMLDPGFPVSYKENGLTVCEWDYDFNMDVQAKVVSPWPSYSMVLYDLPPIEASYFEIADKVWEEEFPRVVGANTVDEFEKNYLAFLESLFAVGDWKIVYEKKQKAWEDWMKDNDADDRATLRTVTPRSEWNAIMGY